MAHVNSGHRLMLLVGSAGFVRIMQIDGVPKKKFPFSRVIVTYGTVPKWLYAYDSYDQSFYVEYDSKYEQYSFIYLTT